MHAVPVPPHPSLANTQMRHANDRVPHKHELVA